MTFLTKYTLIHKISKTSLFVFVFPFLSVLYLRKAYMKCFSFAAVLERVLSLKF